MKHTSAIVLVGIVFCSCSTFLNRPTTNVNIHSSLDSVRICVNADTSQWYTTPAMITVKRAKEDLKLMIKDDTVLHQLNVKSKLSGAFISNIFYVPPIGFLVDLTTPKRYTYPKSLLINFEEGIPYVEKAPSTLLSPTKNLLCFKISIPEANWFYLNTGHGYGRRFGFLGIAGGAEYYFTNKYYLSAEYGILIDAIVPFPAAVDYDEDNHDSSNAVYGNVQVGSDYKRLHYGVGLQFNKTSYRESRTIELTPEYVDVLTSSMKQTNFGLALSSHFRFSNVFSVGINYYPSFITKQGNVFQTHYSHLLFIDLSFKIEAYRPKKKSQ